MKRIVLFLSMLAIVQSFYTQTVPQKINYQAVMRDANGELVTNSNVNVEVSILSGSSTGSVVYQEMFSLSTNDFGLFYFKIGDGAVLIGSFADIEWGLIDHYLNVKANGVDLGTNQFVSVPYALSSESASQINGVLVSAASPNDGDQLVFNAASQQWEPQQSNGFSGDYNDLVNKPSLGCCGFRASTTSTQQVVSSGVHVGIEYIDEKFDDGGNYDPVSSVYSAPETGVYHFDAEIGLGNTEHKYFYFEVNGSFVQGVADFCDCYYHLSTTLSLNAGDQVRCVVYSFNLSSTIIWNGTGNSFSGYKIY